MKLILISGAPATGKTRLGKLIANRFGFDYCSKDGLKESLFDTSNGHKSWSKFEHLAREQFFRTIEEHIDSGKPLIAENNFMVGDKQRLLACIDKHTELGVIHCKTRGITSFMRFLKRSKDGSRHRDHHDYIFYLPMLLLALASYIGLSWPLDPMDVSSKRLEIDTTNFNKTNDEEVFDFVASI